MVATVRFPLHLHLCELYPVVSITLPCLLLNRPLETLCPFHGLTSDFLYARATPCRRRATWFRTTGRLQGGVMDPPRCMALRRRGKRHGLVCIPSENNTFLGYDVACKCLTLEVRRSKSRASSGGVAKTEGRWIRASRPGNGEDSCKKYNCDRPGTFE